MSVEKIHCPWHKDDTPSLAIYENGYHCFGCDKRGPLSDLPNDRVLVKNTFVGGRRFAEDIDSSLAKIRLLPVKEIRGLPLHYDDKSYYIIWPNAKYYKRRFIYAENGDKYRCPIKMSKPPYIPHRGVTHTLIIIEGEANALTIALYGDIPHTILSPGSCSELTRYMSTYLQYSRFIVIVDKDAPGVVGAYYLKQELLKHTKYITIVAMEQDFNDILTQHGKEAVRQKTREMGLQ